MPEMKIPGPDHPITITAHPKRVQVQELGDAARPEEVRDTILPTDDGAGQSQRDHWAPTVGPR